MSTQKSFDRLLKKVQRLKQRDEAWAGTCRLARMWITPDDAPPYRPYIALLLSDKNKVLRSNVFEQAPTPKEHFEVLLRAMRRPMLGAGWARRPKIVYLDDQDDVVALAPRLAELDIACQYQSSLPAVNEALYAMTTHMGRREPVPGLSSIELVSPPLLGQLYTLAAQFYQVTPWRSLNDQYPLEIRYPPDGKPRYVVMLGSGGEVFGLAVYDTLADLQLMYRPDLSPRQTTQQATWLILFFEEATAMSFDDLDAMAHYSWPVADTQAYPFFGRTTPTQTIVLPTAADLFWFEGALAGILTFLKSHLKFKRGIPQPTEVTLSAPIISGQAQIYLKGPAL